METRHSIIEQATERYLNARAVAIDQELFTFLREQGVSDATTLEGIRKDLSEKGLELVREYQNGESEETHTLKLCKVYAKTTFNIPHPQISNINFTA